MSFLIQKKKEEGVIESSDKDIVAEAERLDVKAMGPLVLTEVLFDEKIREQIKKYRRHFLRVSFFVDQITPEMIGLSASCPNLIHYRMYKICFISRIKTHIKKGDVVVIFFFYWWPWHLLYWPLKVN